LSLAIYEHHVGADRIRDPSVALAKRSYIGYLHQMKRQESKRLCDIRNDFERGVFLSLYNSRPQRLRRVIARIILAVKHALRGTLFSLLLLLPGIYISGVILVRGVREDYNHHVEGYLLQPGFPGRLLFPGSFAR